MIQTEQLSPDRLAFERDGYLVVRGLCPPALCAEVRAQVHAHLNPLLGPAEFEADVGYPGAPASRDEQGGDTPRRLLHAYTRDAAFRNWSAGPQVARQLRALFGRDDVWLSQCHHNCIMTKFPGYSSATLWHQDIRYWSFDRPELISVWLALGPETASNGALKVVPGSHVMSIDRGRLDRDLFLRTELEENQALVAQACTVELQPGDALFFHCRTFHAAGMNVTGQLKLSCVFTYHAGDNQPTPHTRSAQYPGIRL